MTIQIPTQASQVESWAIALLGEAVGSGTMSAVNNDIKTYGGLDNTMNAYYNYLFGNTSTATVAANMAINLGIKAGQNGLTATDVTAAVAYITGQLNAAPAGTQGATVLNILTLWSGMASATSDYTAAAAAYNTLVQSATTYGQNNVSDTLVGNIPTATTFNLTTNQDTATATNFVGTLGGASPTLQGWDNLTGTAGSTANKLTIYDNGTGVDTLPAGLTLTNIQSLSLQTGGNANIDASGQASLTSVTVNSYGTANDSVKASGTAAINETYNGATGTVSTSGGNAVTITSSSTGTVTSDKAAGSVNITADNAAVTVTNAKADITVVAGGSVTAGGTSLNASLYGAVAAATQVADLAAQTAATAAATSASAAKTAATAEVTALTTLAGTGGGGINAVGNTSVTTNNALTLAAANAGTITEAQMFAMNTAYYNALNATGGTALLAQAAEQAVLTPIQTAAAVAVTNATTALNNANTASTAANTVVAADVAAGGASVVFTDTTNTALTTVTVAGNYSNTGAAVVITDSSASGSTLTTVTLNNAGTAALTGNALVNVTDMGGANSITISNSTVGHTQNLTLSDVTAGTITDAAATTVNVISNGAANTAAIAATLATALNISGSGAFTDTGAASDLAANAVITDTGSGAVTMNIAPGQAFTGGSGADTITTGATLQTAAVNGGSNVANTLVVTNAANIATTGAALFSGFSVFEDQASAAVDVSTLTKSTITAVILDSATATVNGLGATAAQTVTDILAGAQTITLGVAGATKVGQLDTVHITANDASGAAQTYSTLSLAGVETLKLTADDALTVSSLTGASALTNLNLDGSGNVSITTGALAVNVNTVVDAHLLTGTFAFDAHLSTLNAMQIIGSSSGANTITGNALNDIITGGNGNDTISNSGGNSTITDGNGNNTITLSGTAGSDTIAVGNGVNTITDASISGTVAVTVGTGSNDVILGAATTDTTGAYTVNIAAGHVAAAGPDTISIGTAGTAFATAPNLVVTGAVTGDLVVLAGDSAPNNLAGTGLSGGAGTITATTITSAATTVALAIGQLEAAVGSATAHEIAVGQYGGNTYIVEANAASAAAAGVTTVIELVGLHTISAVAGSTTLHVAS